MIKYEELKSKLNLDKQYLLEERAAIFELEGGFSREEAEAKALKWWNEEYIPSTYAQKGKVNRK